MIRTNLSWGVICGYAALDQMKGYVFWKQAGSLAIEYDPLAKARLSVVATWIEGGDATYRYIMSQAEYAGSVDPATQDWTVEVRIPWSAMQGDFEADVFPPSAGDSVGF